MVLVVLLLLLLRYAFEFALSLSAIGQAALIGKNSGRVVIVLNPNAVQVLVEGPPLPANSYPEGGTNGPPRFQEFQQILNSFSADSILRGQGF